MSTTAILPTQAAVMSDIERLKKKLAEPASQEAAEAAMAAAIKDPKYGVEQKLLEQVQALGDSAKRVDAAFTTVSTQLASIDNNNYLDQNGKPVKKLKPIWDGFHQRFKRYLWTSRDTATDTATYILSFYKVILPAIEQTLLDASQPGVTYSEKKEMIKDIRADLQRFIERPNPATQASNRPVPAGADPYTVAQAHSQDFLDLKAEIEAFAGTFDNFAAGTQATLNAELLKVTNQINSITVEIAGYDTVVKAMGIAMGATAVGAGAAAAVAFFCGPWGPMISLGILITGALAVIAELGTLIAYLKKKADAEDELNKAKARKAALEKELDTLKAVKSLLQTQKTDITYICQRLDQFANIWAMVASNAREVDGLLANAAEPTSSLTTLSGNIAMLKSGYAALYSGLKAYATNVAGSGVSKPTA